MKLNDSKSRKVSVVIPTANRRESLVEAVKSVSSQSLLPYDLVIIDDCSTVPVEKDWFSFCDNELDIKIIRNKELVGGCGARNIGLQHARGSYVAFLDDDDVFLPGKVEAIDDLLKTNAPSIISCSARVVVGPRKISYLISPSSDVGFTDQLIKNEIGTTSMVAVDRNFLLSVGGFDELLPARQDYETWLRALKNGASYQCIDSILTEIRVSFSNKSISKSYINNVKAVSIIEKKYSGDILNLEVGQSLRRENAVYNFLIHKKVVGGENFSAIKMLLKASIRFKSISSIAGAFSLLFGRSAFFKLLSIKQSFSK